MTEYKKFDPVWVPASIFKVDSKDPEVVQVVLAADGGWLETSDLRPRAEGATPVERKREKEDGMTYYERMVIDRARRMARSEDVLRLVSTLESLAGLLETRLDMVDETQEPKQAATPGPPIEGPARVGDTVKLEGVVTAISDGGRTAYVDNQRMGWRKVTELTIVSRPAPSEESVTTKPVQIGDTLQLRGAVTGDSAEGFWVWIEGTYVNFATHQLRNAVIVSRSGWKESK